MSIIWLISPLFKKNHNENKNQLKDCAVATPIRYQQPAITNSQWLSVSLDLLTNLIRNPKSAIRNLLILNLNRQVAIIATRSESSRSQFKGHLFMPFARRNLCHA